jgi:hypothetical protein
MKVCLWRMDQRADIDALSSILTVLVSDQAPALLGFDETIDQYCKNERTKWFDNKFYPQVSTTTSPTPPKQLGTTHQPPATRLIQPIQCSTQPTPSHSITHPILSHCRTTLIPRRPSPEPLHLIPSHLPQDHAGSCLNSNHNILSLYGKRVQYNLCRNLEWQAHAHAHAHVCIHMPIHNACDGS